MSASSVTVQENLAIGCFSYKGLLILSRAKKNSRYRSSLVDVEITERKYLSIHAKRKEEKSQRQVLHSTNREHFLVYFQTEEFLFASPCSTERTSNQNGINPIQHTTKT